VSQDGRPLLMKSLRPALVIGPS